MALFISLNLALHGPISLNLAYLALSGSSLALSGSSLDLSGSSLDLSGSSLDLAWTWIWPHWDLDLASLGPGSGLI